MVDKPDAIHTLGLEMTPSCLRGVALTSRKDIPFIDKLFEITLPPNEDSTEHVNPLYMSQDGKELNALIKQNHLVVTVLSTNEVLTRPLEVKLKQDSDIDDVLAFQAEPLLPYPVANAVVDRIKVSPTTEGTQLTLLAVRRDHLAAHLQNWEKLNIEPEVVSSVPVALTSFSNLFFKSENPYFVLYLGHENTSCALIRDGKLLYAQSCGVGIENLLTSYAKDHATEDANGQALHQIDFSAFSEDTNPYLAQTLEKWRQEITKILYGLSKQIKGAEPSQILLCGEGSTYKNLVTALLQKLNKEIVNPISTIGFTSLSTEELQKFAIPIGAALTALPHHTDQVNFRQQEFAFPHPWKRFKIPIITYFALSLLLAGAIFLCGKAYVSYSEDNVKKEYVELLATMNKSYPDFESEFRKKTNSATTQELIPVTLLTQEEILNRLSYLQNEVKSSPEAFPLLPNTPNVSDVLAWLSKHPKAIERDSGNKIVSALNIDNFSYTMVKRPDQTKKQEKYQVKIELEFSSPTPKLAREFHDALISPNDFIDPKGEVKWNNNAGKYRTSFFLKDKTSYPSSGNL